VVVIDLTTVARVKLGLAIDATDVTHDVWLGTTITAVSGRIERFIDRAIEIVSRTQEFDVHNITQETIWLRTYPNIVITDIRNDADWEFTAASVIDATDYRVDEDNGQIHFRDIDLEIGPKAVQITYTAGLAVDTAQVIADYPDLALAADTQVAATFRRRSSPQGQSSSAGGDSITHEGPLQLIPEVRQTLLPLRRLRFGI